MALVFECFSRLCIVELEILCSLLELCYYAYVCTVPHLTFQIRLWTFIILYSWILSVTGHIFIHRRNCVDVVLLTLSSGFSFSLVCFLIPMGPKWLLHTYNAFFAFGFFSMFVSEWIQMSSLPHFHH